jgi:hypothetical protein
MGKIFDIFIENIEKVLHESKQRDLPAELIAKLIEAHIRQLRLSDKNLESITKVS